MQIPDNTPPLRQVNRDKSPPLTPTLPRGGGSWGMQLIGALDGRHSSLVHPTLWKSSLTRASTDGEVFRRRQLRESLTELLQKGHFHTVSIFLTLWSAALALITLFRCLPLDHVRNFDNFSKSGLTVMRP